MVGRFEDAGKGLVKSPWTVRRRDVFKVDEVGGGGLRRGLEGWLLLGLVRVLVMLPGNEKRPFGSPSFSLSGTRLGAVRPLRSTLDYSVVAMSLAWPKVLRQRGDEGINPTKSTDTTSGNMALAKPQV